MKIINLVKLLLDLAGLICIVIAIFSNGWDILRWCLLGILFQFISWQGGL